MSWSVFIRQSAIADLREARDWYRQQRPELLQEFLDATNAAQRSLEGTPYAILPYYLGFRRIMFKGFPYKLFFQVEKDAVIVYRILHVLREQTWKLR